MDELKWEISRINILKVATLAKTNEMLWNYWDEALEYRPSRHLNALLGQEVDRLIDMSHKYTLGRDEFERHKSINGRYWNMCPENCPYDGHCLSRHGVRCKMPHGRED